MDRAFGHGPFHLEGVGPGPGAGGGHQRQAAGGAVAAEETAALGAQGTKDQGGAVAEQGHGIREGQARQGTCGLGQRGRDWIRRRSGSGRRPASGQGLRQATEIARNDEVVGYAGGQERPGQRLIFRGDDGVEAGLGPGPAQGPEDLALRPGQVLEVQDDGGGIAAGTGQNALDRRRVDLGPANQPLDEGAAGGVAADDDHHTLSRRSHRRSLDHAPSSSPRRRRNSSSVSSTVPTTSPSASVSAGG